MGNGTGTEKVVRRNWNKREKLIISESVQRDTAKQQTMF
jgi:hypothetical protein